MEKSTARGRELGAELKKRRKAAGWQSQELARKLGWSVAKVSRMETGVRGQSEVDVAIYLTTCGVHRHELNALLDLAREAVSALMKFPSRQRFPLTRFPMPSLTGFLTGTTSRTLNVPRGTTRGSSGKPGSPGVAAAGSSESNMIASCEAGTTVRVVPASQPTILVGTACPAQAHALEQVGKSATTSKRRTPF